MCKLYSKRPSEILKIDDEYTAFCLDEALAYMLCKMENGEEPNYNIRKNKNKMKQTRFKRPSEMYEYLRINLEIE